MSVTLPADGSAFFKPVEGASQPTEARIVATNNDRPNARVTSIKVIPVSTNRLPTSLLKRVPWHSFGSVRQRLRFFWDFFLSGGHCQTFSGRDRRQGDANAGAAAGLGF